MHVNKTVLDLITNYNDINIYYKYPSKARPQLCRLSSFPEAFSPSKCKQTFIGLVSQFPGMAKRV